MRTAVRIIIAVSLAVLVIVLFDGGVSLSKADTAYIANAEKDTGASNVVTAIYLNYRMFDSIFETLILLISATAVIDFSWRKDNE